MRTRTYAVLSLLAVLVSWGCGDTAPKRRNASGTIGGAGLTDSNAVNSAPAAPQQPADGQVPTGVAGQPSAPQIPGVQADTQSAIPSVPGTAPATPGTVTVPAAPGVTGKGNYQPGIITTPISVYFHVQERLIFDQVTYAIKLYEGEHGFKPKTQDSFMKEIIEFNQLKLPKLPEGHTYKYDPMKGELMVEQPG